MQLLQKLTTSSSKHQVSANLNEIDGLRNKKQKKTENPAFGFRIAWKLHIFSTC